MMHYRRLAGSANNIPFLRPDSIYRRRLHVWNVAIFTAMRKFSNGYTELSLQGANKRWQTRLVRDDSWCRVLSLLRLETVEELVGLQVWIKLYLHKGKIAIADIDHCPTII